MKKITRWGCRAIKGRSEKICLPEGESSPKTPPTEILFTADHCPDVLWSYNVETRCWNYVSPSIRALSGYHPDEMMDISLEKFLAPSSFQYFMEQVSSAWNCFLMTKSIHI